jgi:putative ABC transport system permease protein
MTNEHPSTASGRRAALDIGPELTQGYENLRAHKLRSILTMLGMIFGVAAVIAMLSIGAGAQQQVIAFIEQLGVRNVIVEARESGDNQTLQRVRQLSAGLTFADLRAIEATTDGLVASSARKRFVPSKTLPRAQGDIPAVFGVSAGFVDIGGLTMARGRFFDADEEAGAAAVTVLGQSAATSFFVGGMPAQDSNNVAYVPITAAIYRIEDSQAYLRDEIDAIYLRLANESQVTTAGVLVRGLLDATHRAAGDFTVIVPAELLAQQQQTRRLFQFVMVAIASISLLVGGIGIMNIMLASVMERTREIGVRRAVGATRRDVIRQFLVETTLITITGGLAGTVVGIVLSQLVAYLAGWSTVVSVASVVVACVVSVSIGIIFGLYPAARAARLDPVSALHYE